jgi:isochorismate synthase
MTGRLPHGLRCIVEEEVADLDLLGVVARARERPLFWMEHPESGVAVAGIGSAAEIRSRGPGRFAEASGKAREVFARVNGGMPRLVGGFGFSDESSDEALPPLLLWLPRVLWCRDRNRTRAILAGADIDSAARLRQGLRAAAPAAVPSEAALLAEEIPLPEQRERWRRRVERVQALLASGAVEKVVLARERRLRVALPVALAPVLARLRAERPSCFTFWVGLPGADFIGSSPEVLVCREGQEVWSLALAGSAPRGTSPAEDRHFGEVLVACPKNCREHLAVVTAARAALEPVTCDLEVSAKPELWRLPEVQHLASRIRGRLRDGSLSALDLAARLHPTPAVCGVPAPAARALIEREEPGRGWYSGAVGWLAAEGDGQFVVALRSALIRGDRIYAWAGAGIVSGSEADVEYAETEGKFRALFGRAIRVGGERAA